MIKYKKFNVFQILLFVTSFVGLLVISHGAHISAQMTTDNKNAPTTTTSSTTGRTIQEVAKYCTDDQDVTFRLKMGEQGPGPKGTCKLVKCEDVVNGKAIFKAIGCGVFIPTPGCNATDYDNTKTYPDCCPNEIC